MKDPFAARRAPVECCFLENDRGRMDTQEPVPIKKAKDGIVESGC